MREVFDALLFVTRTGLQWRNLSETKFPDWQAVYYYFDKWKKDGTLENVNLALNQKERIKKGRKASPSLTLVDSQSVKLAPQIYEERGIDGNKKVNGRKRHILVDVTGRIYRAHVHAANLHDSPQGINLLDNLKEELDRLKVIMTDKSYRGTFAQTVEKMGLSFEVPFRPEGVKGFITEAKRWVIERSFAWLNHFRRVVIDYEHCSKSAVAFLLLANISMTLSSLKT